jgi:CRISPR-associated protein (TIGR02584 family)
MVPNPERPSSYPRRILLAVTGMSPQVVTETLYSLAVRRADERFVPTEIHLITTARGAEHARLNLLSQEPGWFHRLRREYRLPEITFDASRIYAIPGPNGEALEDIRTKEDNERAADYITERVRALTADPNSALHVSIAGGRKTMGYYIGYALSLYGRPQDRLSHVLVSAPYESHPQFYYPTRGEYVIHTLDNQRLALDCRKAEVTLADIPFVRLRDGLPQRLLDGQASFSSIVEAANRAIQPPELVLDLKRKKVVADGQEVKLGNVEFAILLWFAQRVQKNDHHVDWSSTEAVNEFLRVAKTVMNPAGGDFERIEEALSWRKGALKIAKYFEPHKSRINAAFEYAVGKRSAGRYAIQRLHKKGFPPRYGLPLAPDQIRIQRT